MLRDIKHNFFCCVNSILNIDNAPGINSRDTGGWSNDIRADNALSIHGRDNGRWDSDIRAFVVSSISYTRRSLHLDEMASSTSFDREQHKRPSQVLLLESVKTSNHSLCAPISQRKMPIWMKKSYKTVSYFLLSYVIVYLPSIVYIMVMVCDPNIKENDVSRGINFLTPCVHSIVASFIYIRRVKEIGLKFKCVTSRVTAATDV